MILGHFDLSPISNLLKAVVPPAPVSFFVWIYCIIGSNWTKSYGLKSSTSTT